ncbi:hypothetical protein LINGRAHAP2_LOCUS8403 [Linum grandiflorum]
MLWLKRFLQELGLKQNMLTKIVPGSKVKLCSKLAGMRFK